ncbi:MAG: hypothetical protein IJ257_00595 [Treponema sp.]|nr:hypothetical protein [Treponema sp.]
MLKSSISAPTYGKNVSSGQKSFNCELHPEDTILTFAASDEKLKILYHTYRNFTR